MALIATFNPPEPSPEDIDEFIFCGERFEVAKQTALPFTRFAWDARRIDGLQAKVAADLRRVEAELALARADGETVRAERLQSEVNELTEKSGQLEAEALAALHQTLMDQIGVHQWPRFQELAIERRVNIDYLMSIVQTLAESATSRPTTSSTVSSDGQSTSGNGSPDASSLVVEPPGPTITADALTPAERQRLEILVASQPVAARLSSV